jgi:peroxiredoxin
MLGKEETKMAVMGPGRAVQPGEAAPDFEVPAVHREGTVSLADYRGRTPVFLALFRGLY